MQKTPIKIAVQFIFAAITCTMLFSALPLMHYFFGDQRLKESENAANKIREREIVIPPKKPEPKKEVKEIRETTSKQTNQGPRSSFKFDFSPDLSVGSGGGVAVQDDNLENMVFEEGDVDQKPTPQSRRVPPIPSRLLNLGVSGEVVMVLTVDREGKVADVLIEKAPHPDIGSFFKSAARRWRFEPAYKDGIAVKCRVKQPFDFKLRHDG